MADPWAPFWMTCAAVLTSVLTALGGYAVAYLNERRDAIKDERKRKATDDAVAAVAERARQEPGLDKLREAVRLADAATPKSVTVTPDDALAAVDRRRRASLPTPDSTPLGSLSPPPLSSRPPSDPFRERDTAREKAPIR